MPKPKVSVIIPTYNRSNELARCLQSLTIQTYKNFEAIVCDDGSTDDTKSVVKKFSTRLIIKYSHGQNSGGPAAPRNRGILLSSGELIAFLDSDDWWEKDKLKNSIYELDKGADFVFHRMKIFTPGATASRKLSQKNARIYKPVLECILCSGLSIPNSSVVTSKDLIAKIGGFCEDKKMISVEDIDAWLKITRITNNFIEIPKADGYYSLGSSDNISTASPEQASKVECFYGRHISYVSTPKKSKAIGYMCYKKCRILLNCSNHSESMREAITALRMPIDFRWKIKAIASLCSAFLKRRTESRKSEI